VDVPGLAVVSGGSLRPARQAFFGAAFQECSVPFVSFFVFGFDRSDVRSLWARIGPGELGPMLHARARAIGRKSPVLGHRNWPCRGFVRWSNVTVAQKLKFAFQARRVVSAAVSQCCGVARLIHACWTWSPHDYQ